MTFRDAKLIFIEEEAILYSESVKVRRILHYFLEVFNLVVGSFDGIKQEPWLEEPKGEHISLIRDQPQYYLSHSYAYKRR